MLRVLIAEDSQVVQRTLQALLADEPGIEIVGTANDGAEALALCRELQPDLVTMDIFMPEMDGLEATRRIMDECPTRIVIISSMVGPKDQRTTFEAMRAGAIEVIEKPHGVLLGNYEDVKYNLSRVLRKMAHARPVNQLSWLPPAPRDAPLTTAPPAPAASGPPRSRPAAPPTGARPGRIPRDFAPSIVCLGGSTGAPAVLVEVLAALGADYPLPIVVAQHIARGFARGLADWLDASSPLAVKVAEQGDVLGPGRVFIGPDDRHFEVTPSFTLSLRAAASRQEHVPSVNRFFASVARVYGDKAFAAVLSGMGSDGAEGLQAMRDAGAVTVVQAEPSCVVFGMPKVAMESGAAMREVTPQQLAALLEKMAASARPR